MTTRLTFLGAGVVLVAAPERPLPGSGPALAAVTAAGPVADFRDVAASAGLTARTVIGGEHTKDYILETTGGGVAILDYDNDGWPDIFLVNGSRLPGSPNDAPTSHLYRNNGDGTFSDVTAKAGLAGEGWGQGVCAGDYDNDGHIDLFVTYYGHQVLYRNNGDGTFADVTRAERSPAPEPAVEYRRGLPRLRSRRPSGPVRVRLRGLRGRDPLPAREPPGLLLERARA